MLLGKQQWSAKVTWYDQVGYDPWYFKLITFSVGWLSQGRLLSCRHRGEDLSANNPFRSCSQERVHRRSGNRMRQGESERGHVQFQTKSSHSLMSTGTVGAQRVPCPISVNELSYSPVAPVCHCLKETLGELRTVHWYEAALGSQEKSLKVWAENLRSRAWKKCQGLWAGCCSFLELS